jgi:hypothetical protein
MAVITLANDVKFSTGVGNCSGSLAYHLLKYVRYEVLAAVNMTLHILWNVTP